MKGLVIALGILAIAIVGAILAIPQLVKKKCIDTAAEDGVSDDRRRASRWGTVHLSDVNFTIPEVPQITGAASDVDIALSGLAPQTITALNVGVTIQGSAESVMTAVDAWRAKHAKPPGKAADAAAAAEDPRPERAHLLDGRVRPSRKIDASSITAETDGNGTSFKLTADKTTIGTPKGDVGPWRMLFERDAASVRTRFELDSGDARRAEHHVRDDASRRRVDQSRGAEIAARAHWDPPRALRRLVGANNAG